MTVRNLNSDQFALLEFKDRIGGPQIVLADNWTASTSVCNWIGVSCGILHKRVIALNLTSMNLRGTIPPHLGNLSFLLSLDLSSNHFYGHLPKELGQLHRLRILQLSYNRLNGEIPSWLGNLQRVRRLQMKNNYFTGTIPETLIIILSSNSLSGSLPNDMCQHLPKLEVLYLHSNELSGNIPSSMGKCSNLKNLSLSLNQLTGIIPRSIGNLTQLRELYLGFNNLEGLYLHSNELFGSIPFGMGNLPPITNAPKLEILALWGNKLRGNIPNSISNASMLKILDLEDNLFSGPIPKTLGNLRHLEWFQIMNNNLITGSATDHEWSFLSSLTNCKNLKTIGVSGNPLSGVLPTYIGNLSKSLQYFYASNCELQGIIPMEIGCFSNFSSTSFMKNYALCGPPRLLVPPCKNDIHKNSQMIILHLSRATNGFEESNMLGSGSFGYVYKGRLSDGMEVAIKVFNLQTEGAFSSFDIECDAMRNIVHRNIVKVITCCSSVDFKALVLAYMSNGNLEKWLHSENCFLDIIQRVDIMIDVAVAIEHLHNGHPTPIIHCDIKPSNILLDEDMVAHVGDCGVAKLLGEGEVMKQTMTLATIGYIAPEFGSVGIVSIKSDIYSYGIVLIETFTKKKPTDNVFVEEESIRHWMERSLPKGAIEIADVDLLRREDEYIVVKANCISSIMELALNCSAELPEERKDMKDVVVELKKIKQRLLNNIQHF
ncbi:hypothetical protein GOBAR_DD25388 [Gossypium barbadense]|nr:hypothetical protein GOBAR_DD25388 [Gossypium barbadense]